jgi:DNA-binding NarL/FixJ family response regulator
MNPKDNTANSPARILVVDDHAMTRYGILQLLNQQTDMNVCGEAETAHQALTAVDMLQPDLVLVDLTMPGRSGLELIKDIHAMHPKVNVLVVSMHDESLYAERVLRMGARGYIMKNEGGKKLLEAIRRVLQSKVYVSENISERILDTMSGRPAAASSALASLTDRELEVFLCIGQGLSTHEIATQLHLSAKTVETHRLHARAKLGLKSGPELMKFAVRWVGTQQSI